MIDEIYEEVEPDIFARFVKNGAYYAWVEVPVQMLNVVVPEGVDGSQIFGDEMDAEGNRVYLRQKVVGEFILGTRVSLDQQYVIAPLSWMERPILRTKKTPRWEMENWKAFLAAYSLSVDRWLDIEQYKLLLNTNRYKTEEGV